MSVFFLAHRGGFSASVCVVTALALHGCGGGETLDDAAVDGRMDAAGRDAGQDDGGNDAGTHCGDGVLEIGEACDDGNRRPNDGCSPSCVVECGDGLVGAEELCDTAIASGEPGSCPSSCDDGEACTRDTLLGVGCTARCFSTDVTRPGDGDGCCPTGASSLTDDDCAIACGNGLLEAGELCDTGIATGAGSCPTGCDDGAVCTTDRLLEAGGCAARCEWAEITAAASGDGCCPAGATVASDTDCSPACGDGVFTPATGELCDTGIVSGPGSCPSSCDDGMVCTRDMLVGAGSCTASCTHTVLPPLGGDACCPPGATIATDSDCVARCGDGVRTAPEACDDGNTVTGDGCSPTCTREPRAYRFTQITIQDPRPQGSGGLDVTPEVNTALRRAASMDETGPSGGPDGILDLSIVLRFDPLDQDAAMVAMHIDTAACTAPVATTSCTGRSPELHVAYNRASGECLGPLPGTIPVGRPVNTPTAPCFSSDEVPEFSLRIGDATLHFRHSQLGAQYVGDPASELVTGLVRAFLPESDATGLMIGSITLSEALRPSDRDTVDGVGGWWFYLAFTAVPVPYAMP